MVALPDLSKYTHVVVLSGAGLSAESGVPTFRDSNGLWENHRVEDVASPKGFERDPHLVWRFYCERRKGVLTVEPNAAHRALVALERRFGEKFFFHVTQNVDGLDFRAGAQSVGELHGNLFRSRCTNGMCERFQAYVDASIHDVVPHCDKCGCVVRPDIVWFGESVNHDAMHRAYAVMMDCENMRQQHERYNFKGPAPKLLFVAVGTSGQVFPAAAMAGNAREFYRADTVYVGVEEPANASVFDHVIIGKAGEVLPRWVG